MRVKSAKEAQWKYWSSCLRAYLQGKKTLNWIVGVLDVGSLEQFDQLVRELEVYGQFQRQADTPIIRKRIAANIMG